MDGHSSHRTAPAALKLRRRRTQPPPLPPLLSTTASWPQLHLRTTRSLPPSLPHPSRLTLMMVR
ncbi:hypothetical protein SLEP1_g30315 [Rubroshorea leprosula]|uniref:Uncharacterized protein n=1 Tax=Rubroshorea leprosula TaxID=152421 RepID=A0AAV5JZQ4_9ROSI|nr:hypothetical protein SLEP1_g30315 [Rubroshorea leprosula]